eukprot:m.168070 g.168070  ORF g.168070 m.168070 type:complete len:190 (-) comp31490_c0_seq1:2305-2874(-)
MGRRRRHTCKLFKRESEATPTCHQGPRALINNTRRCACVDRHTIGFQELFEANHGDGGGSLDGIDVVAGISRHGTIIWSIYPSHSFIPSIAFIFVATGESLSEINVPITPSNNALQRANPAVNRPKDDDDDGDVSATAPSVVFGALEAFALSKSLSFPRNSEIELYFFRFITDSNSAAIRSKQPAPSPQ